MYIFNFVRNKVIVYIAYTTKECENIVFLHLLATYITIIRSQNNAMLRQLFLRCGDVSCEAWRALAAVAAPGRLYCPDTTDVLAGPSDGHIPSVFVIHAFASCALIPSASRSQIGDLCGFL